MLAQAGTEKLPRFVIAIVLYSGCDLLDVAGPYEVFNFLNGTVIERQVEVVTVARDQASLQVLGGLLVTPLHSFQTCPKIDLLFVPGAGPSLVDMLADDQFLDFLRVKAAEARYVTSVCTGGLLLAAAGLLDGYKATTHWSVIDCLRLFPKVKVVNGCPRYVRDRNRITGGGISSAIDEALFMVQILVADLSGDPAKGTAVAHGIQLSIQYNPQPPFQGGDPCSVDYSVYAPAAEGMKGFREEVCAAVAKRVGSH
jgi:cyclohexyl-isocyanide hydratase